MRPIVRKKMYKKGKFWVVAGIVTILGGSAILGQDVKAEQAEAVTSTISEKTDSSQTISDTSKLTLPVNSSEAMKNSAEPLIKTGFATSVSSNPREIAATPVKTFDASSKVVVKASTAEHSANQTNSNVNQVANDSEVITQQNSTKQLPTVTYSAHVQDIGWQKSVDNATVSGTVGQEKQVEAIKLSIKAPEGITGKLSYKTYVKGQGWQPSVESGQVSGTVGQSRPIEALSINLTDNLQKLYDVYYRVHVQDIGWMAWAKNGAYAGTLGMSKRLEAYEVKFTLKGQSVLTPTIPKEERPVLNYQVKVGQNGWQSNKLEGQMAGTLGETGCVPTSLAMILSSLKGETVLPTQIADYLYHKTVEFNRGVQGTTSRGILKAAKEWGVTATALGTQANLVQALKDGYHVLAAVQNNVFVLHGSHEIVLKGYNNGLTHVSDPYTPSLSGWYPISQLWKEQSYYSEDRIDIGAPFVKVTDA